MAIDITKNYDWNSTGEDHEEPAVKIFKKWGRVPWVSRRLPQGEVVGSKMWWHEILSWMWLGRRAGEWPGSGDDSKEENFFSLGPAAWGLRRNHSYVLRNINRRNVLRQSQVLVRRWNFQKRDWGIGDFSDWPRGTVERFQGLKRVEIAQDKEIHGTTWELLSGGKELLGSSELLEADINCKDDSASPHGR